ncbi:hypothetical protein D9M70_458760 [compost metagenome]
MNSTAKAADRNVQASTGALSFRDTQFDVVDRNGQPWLRSPQIAEALGYADASSINRIYARNSDEFTGSMTGSVKLTDPNGALQETRIFSLRGAHLLGMFARTKVAKEFRSWVLDVLEGIAEVPKKTSRKPKALPNGLTSEQQDSIKALVKARAECLPKDRRAKATITCWSALKSKFGCSYKEIGPEHFTDALGLVARIVLEGEFLEAEAPKPLDQLEIDFTVARWIANDPNGFRLATLTYDDRIGLPYRTVASMDSKSPTYELLKMLEDAGYQIEACKLELLALKDHVDVMHGVMGNLQRALDNTMQRSILWNCRTKRSAV